MKAELLTVVLDEHDFLKMIDLKNNGISGVFEDIMCENLYIDHLRICDGEDPTVVEVTIGYDVALEDGPSEDATEEGCTCGRQ